MRLMRLGNVGEEFAAVALDEHRAIDVSDLVARVDGQWLAAGGLAELRSALPQLIAERPAIDLATVRIGSPISQPHQILCIGLNYADHAAESNMPLPSEPVVFTKSPNTMVGPNDSVRIPRGSSATDWEVELGIVIGARARYLDTPEQAWDCIAGFVLVNDVSERDFQLHRNGQWVKGKSAETFNPTGPWLLPKEDFTQGLDNLSMRLWVNGVLEQDGSTADMVFRPIEIVQYLSQFMVLEPGDLINTGTPAGVGLGKTPQRFLVEGDVMELSIEHLGTQRQELIRWDAEG